MRFQVTVYLKPEVHDPEGQAICQTLSGAGYPDVTHIRVGKRYVIDLKDDCHDPEKKVAELAQSYLANPVAETYTIEREA